MSESIRRKSSSRQLLQNLIRVTAQRSQEDAEEVEREQRRRSREKERGQESPVCPEPPQHKDLEHNIELDQDLTASCCLVLEEDEGFSDWSHRLENRNEQDVPDDCRASEQRRSTPQWKQEPGEDKQREDEEDKQQKDEEEKQRKDEEDKQREPGEDKQREDEEDKQQKDEEEKQWEDEEDKQREDEEDKQREDEEDKQREDEEDKQQKDEEDKQREPGEDKQREDEEDKQQKDEEEKQREPGEDKQREDEEDKQQKDEEDKQREPGEDKQREDEEDKQWEDEEEKQWEDEEDKQREDEEDKQREPGEDKQREPGEDKQREDKEEERCEPERSSWSLKGLPSPLEEMYRKTEEVTTPYSSTVFVLQDSRLQHCLVQPAGRTSYSAAQTLKPSGGSCRVDGQVEQEEHKVEEEVQTALQTEWRSAETQHSHREEDDQVEEELSFTHEVKEILHLRGEERHMEEEEEEEEEEHKMSHKRSSEDRRSEEVSRRPSHSLSSSSSSSRGDESLYCYGPMSPTFKKLLIQFYPEEVNSRVSTEGKCSILERTESLRKSTNNIKKTLLPVSKIDKKLEQYTQALEVSSKEGRSGSLQLTDLMSAAGPVSSKKNLFEAWNQNAVSVTPSKDADGLKVAVADLINQWVKGSEDGSRCSSPSKPAEMRPVGVLNKKGLWKIVGDSPGKDSSGERFRFVGHGKYEKVSADDGCSEDADCQSAGQFYEETHAGL